jgi:acyl-coenzyme A synthetase/AMP-(fatty) acid ligase
MIRSLKMSVRQVAQTFGRSRLADRPQPLPVVARVTLSSILEEKAATDPTGTPFQVIGRTLTFRAWHAAASQVASGLVGLGVAPGTRVGLVFDGLDWLSYAVAYLGTLRAGGTAVHLNATMPTTDLEARLIECGVAFIIRSSFVTPPAKGIESRTVGELMALGEGGLVPRGIECETADIRYTSGTTGPAKGYFIPHSNLTFGQTLAGMRDLSRSSAMLVPMTLGSSTSATVIVAGLTSAARMILCSPNEVEEMGSIIAAQRVDSLMLTPHVAEQIIDAGLWERHDLSSVQLVAFASSPLFPALVRRLVAALNAPRIQLACAQSEASPALLVHTYDFARPFSIGRPSGTTEVRIVDADGADVAPGRVGEIWLHHAAPLRFMIRQPEFNSTLAADGWYRTGDLGRWNTEGEVEFFDRKVDAIKRGATIISSLAVESAIAEHAAVREVAVISTSCSDSLEAEIVAFVTLRYSVPLQQLAALAAELLPPESRPDRFVVTTAIPRTQNGKISKRLLRLRGVVDTAWLPGEAETTGFRSAPQSIAAA